ncbi:MAG: aldo/keto reductase [Eubacteriales bacterium]|nr:aldo/keto reductase [Eubacteriales bacterium]
MLYVPFGKLGFNVSRLGFGTMRLPTVQSDEGAVVIDRQQAIAMIRHAIDQGVNYVDTAYGYHNGESEIVTGLALKNGYRERAKLATKLPQWLVREHKDMDRLLDEQLKKLDVPYLDFYLLHALNRDAFERLKNLDYQSFLKRCIKDGRVRHVGFSFHDDAVTFRDILDNYAWEMAQIQFNYLDDRAQATLDGLLYAGEKGIPVVVMEPLRGGALANPPKEIAERISQNRFGASPAELAFRYVSHFSQVVTILSGMSSPEQVEDNLRIFEDVPVGGLSAEDLQFVSSVKAAYLDRTAIGCTACNYCQPCPQGVNIPGIFDLNNRSYRFGDNAILKNEYKQFCASKQDASSCVSCGVCEEACPQQLPIISTLKEIEKMAGCRP